MQKLERNVPVEWNRGGCATDRGDQLYTGLGAAMGFLAEGTTETGRVMQRLTR